MAKKSNGIGPETVLAENSGLEIATGVLVDLDAAFARPGPLRMSGNASVSSGASLRAAVVDLSSGDELLCVGEPRRGQPEWLWHTVARFSRQRVGSHDFIAARRFNMPLTGQLLAALHGVFGETDFDAYDNGKFTARLVEIEAAGEVTLPTSASRVVFVRFRQLWLPIGGVRTRFSGYAPSRVEQEAERNREQGHPGLNVI